MASLIYVCIVCFDTYFLILRWIKMISYAILNIRLWHVENSRFPDLDSVSLGVKKFGSLRKYSSGSLGVWEARVHTPVCCCMTCIGCLKYLSKVILSTLRVTICTSTELFLVQPNASVNLCPLSHRKIKEKTFQLLTQLFSFFPFSHLVHFTSISFDAREKNDFSILGSNSFFFF